MDRESYGHNIRQEFSTNLSREKFGGGGGVFHLKLCMNFNMFYGFCPEN